MTRKCRATISPLGDRAGGLTPQAARWTGLKPGTAVAIANVDAHVSVPAATVTEPGRMVMIMGTSICHMVLGTEEHLVPGMCGYVEDGIIPGFFGYEAGQSCVGDHFAWFVENAVPPEYHAAAKKRKARPAPSARRRSGQARSRASRACSRSIGGMATARRWWMWT